VQDFADRAQRAEDADHPDYGFLHTGQACDGVAQLGDLVAQVCVDGINLRIELIELLVDLCVERVGLCVNLRVERSDLLVDRADFLRSVSAVANVC